MMTSWLPAVRYPPAPQPGYWDPITSTLNWCEEVWYCSIESYEKD